MNIAASGGIPITPVTSGGVITKVRLEHIWVEAAIDYQPSKGAVNRDADSWVAMDPSYKLYEFLEGLDAVAISGIDPEALAQQFVDSGTVNEAEGWVSGFDPKNLWDTHQNENTKKKHGVKIEVHLPGEVNVTKTRIGVAKWKT